VTEKKLVVCSAEETVGESGINYRGSDVRKEGSVPECCLFVLSFSVVSLCFACTN